MKKIILIVLIFLAFLPQVNALELYSDKSLLINLNDDKILIDNKSDEITSIASLTKIMTTIVAIENLKNFDTKITITKDMFYRLDEENLYQVGLIVGQKPTVNDLLYATFIASGADATRALTSAITDSEDTFVEMMNEKAIELKMENTHFKNPIGTDEEGHYSTLKDLSILFKYAINNKKFMEILETKEYNFSDKTLTIKSSISQTGSYYNLNIDNIVGGKTGYTLAAERCLASIALDKENGISYMLLTTNAKNAPEHIKDAINIYSHYMDNYKYYYVIKENEIIKKVTTKYSKIKKVELKADRDITVYYDKTFNKDLIRIEYSGLEEIKPSDKQIGTVKVYYDNQLLYENTYNNNLEFSITEFIKEHKMIIATILCLLVISIIFVTKKKKI